MTRVNLVPVDELANQHLFAEFRELKMVPKSLARSIAARGRDDVLKRIPPLYVLGAGHVSFFYDKGAFLVRRYAALRAELCTRTVNFNRDALLDPDGVYAALGPEFNKDYRLTPEALKLNQARIKERLDLRRNWYKWT